MNHTAIVEGCNAVASGLKCVGEEQTGVLVRRLVRRRSTLKTLLFEIVDGFKAVSVHL